MDGCWHNMVQIAFDEVDFDEIGQKANQLLEYEGVMYTMYDYPLLMEATATKNLDYVDNNPWSSNKAEEICDKGNESSGQRYDSVGLAGVVDKGSLIAPYRQGSVMLTVEDETEHLYPYRTGKNN